MEEDLLRKQEKELVRIILSSLLSVRDEKIVRMRFGLGYEVHTHAEIAEKFNISRARAYGVTREKIKLIRMTLTRAGLDARVFGL